MQGFEQLDFESVIQEEDKRIKNRNYNIAYINKFSYYEQISNYLNNFNNVHIILFDDFVSDVNNTINGLIDFLGVSKFPFNSSIGSKYNISGKIKIKMLHEFLINPQNRLKTLLRPLVRIFFKRYESASIMNNIIEWNLKKNTIRIETEEKLKNIFKPGILKTQRLINKDLSGWLYVMFL